MRRAAILGILLVVGGSVAPLMASGDGHVAPQTLEAADRDGTDLTGVLTDSLRLLLLEHSVRIAAQEKTRRELGGPFWRDYRRSVRFPQTWNDGDGWLMNYVGHAGHGAAAGFIWLQHDPNGRQRLGRDRDYWLSRGRATIWSLVYAVQFETGPLSEASIGNVGMDPRTTGWVDYVITPVGGFGVMVAEDAIDQWVLEPFERRVSNRVLRATLRMVLNPARAMANVAGVRLPWHRNERRLTSPSG